MSLDLSIYSSLYLASNILANGELGSMLYFQLVKNKMLFISSSAVYYYREAVHLVPDIEFRIAEYEVKYGKTFFKF